jgi:hypothetical protein
MVNVSGFPEGVVGCCCVKASGAARVRAIVVTADRSLLDREMQALRFVVIRVLETLYISSPIDE